MNEYECWLKKISKAEQKYETYHNLIKEIRDYYKNEKSKNKQNIFWSSIETLKPFLYFKTPTVFVERKNKTSNPVEAVACKILEKALIWNLEQFDFDGVIKYLRNDYLLSGMGVAIEQYKPTFKTMEQEILTVDGGLEYTKVELLDNETVETVYVDPTKFIIDVDNVGIWEDVSWVARKIDMTKKEVVEQFGEDLCDFIEDEEDEKTSTAVYEIWDKASEKTIYISKEFKEKILKETPNIMQLSGFFPMPKPIMTSCTNESLIPIPDYIEIKYMLDELDGITERMRLTMKAIKISGCYDKSFPELANMLNKDATLVSISDFKRLKESGGIGGIVDFMPIQQYVDALQVLAQRRSDLIQAIYEITGVSDIMRGNSDPSETATAVTKKTNFGTLRNQDRQNDMQKFITGLLKIKAEMICEQFSANTLSGFAGDENHETVMQAIKLLKEDKLRGMVLGIETDTSFNQSDNLQKVSDAITLIHTMITNAFGVVSQQPLLLPLYKKMIETVVISLPNARQYEPVIEEAFSKIEMQLSQPTPEQPNTEMMKVQQTAQKNQQDYEIKKEQNQIKAEELALKKQVEDNKIMMTNKEAEMQFALKKQQLENDIATSTNITTGYVGGF
jgi:hypothetical protein